MRRRWVVVETLDVSEAARLRSMMKIMTRVSLSLAQSPIVTDNRSNRTVTPLGQPESNARALAPVPRIGNPTQPLDQQPQHRIFLHRDNQIPDRQRVKWHG
jgi:hypothetical protein